MKTPREYLFKQMYGIYIFGFYTRLATYPVGTKQLPKEEKTYKTTKHSSLLQFFFFKKPTLVDFKYSKLK